MKKVLLIGLILAILLLAFPQGVSAAVDSAEVAATMEPVSEVIATFAGGWNLERGTANLFANAISVTVDSNSPWGLTAQDLKAANPGFMVGSDPALTPLKTGFKFHTYGAGVIKDSQTLYGAGQAGQVKNTATPYTYNVDQDVLFNDNSAFDPYTITITFTLTSA